MITCSVLYFVSFQGSLKNNLLVHLERGQFKVEDNSYQSPRKHLFVVHLKENGGLKGWAIDHCNI